MKKAFTSLIVVCFSLLLSSPNQAQFGIAIHIEGLDDTLSTNAYSALTLEREKSVETLSRARVQRLYAQGVDEIRTALEPYGYYHATITPNLEQNDDNIIVSYQVTPGPVVHIRTLDVTMVGNALDDAAMRNLYDAMPLEQGQTLNQQHYETFKRQVLELSASRGYFDATFSTHTITIDTDINTADIVLHFDSGARYQFGEVTFSDNPYSERFLRRFLDFDTGDAFTTQELIELQQDLNNNNYFNLVEVAPLVEEAQGLQIPINVRLEARKPVSASWGAGFGTDTGLRTSLGGQWYRATASGHQLQSLLRLAQFRSSAELRYLIPGPNPTDDLITLSALYLQESPRDDVIESQTTQLSASYLKGNPVTTWSKIFSLSLQSESFDEVDNVRNANLLFPSFGLERIRADNRFNTEHGYRIRFDTRTANKALLSSTSFLQAQLQGKWIYAFNQRQRVILRGDAGYTLTDDLDNVPPSIRFFAGGDNSVRGYGFETLAPRGLDSDNNEIVIGGAHLLVGSIELEHKFKDKWSMATFFDTGQAFDNFSNINLARSVGVGVRYQSPIGPVRIDLAHPLNQSAQVVRLHFTIGPDL